MYNLKLKTVSLKMDCFISQEGVKLRIGFIKWAEKTYLYLLKMGADINSHITEK